MAKLHFGALIVLLTVCSISLAIVEGIGRDMSQKCLITPLPPYGCP